MLKWQFYGIKGRVLLLIITAGNKHFSALKEYFRKNAQVYQYLYAILHPKYFCRVDNPGVKSKLAFDLTFGGYKNEREKIQFTSIKQEVVDSSSSWSDSSSDHNSVVIEQQQQQQQQQQKIVTVTRDKQQQQQQRKRKVKKTRQ